MQKTMNSCDIVNIIISSEDISIYELHNQLFHGQNGLKLYSNFDLSSSLDILSHLISMLDLDDQHLTEDSRFIQLLEKVKNILHKVTEWYPSNAEAYTLLAKLQLELNEHVNMDITCSRCIENCSNPSLVMVVKAQSKLESNDICQSFQTLDQAIAYDFLIQHHPYFCLTKGSILFHKVS